MAALTPPVLRAQAPSLADVIFLGGEYVASYATRTSGVILEEEYLLVELSPRMTGHKRIGSDVVLLNHGGSTIALRDVFAIDKKPTRERTLRIISALEKPTLASWQRAQDYAREGQFHFLTAIVVQVSEPTIALQFLAKANQEKFRYRLDGTKKMNGVAVVGLRFQEPTSRDAVYHLGTRGNASASGRFWLDPKNGAVHQTELWLESPTEVVRTTVNYAPDPALNLLLPKETTEQYDSRELGGGPPSASSAFNLVHKVEGKAFYSNPRFQPIDLSKTK